MIGNLLCVCDDTDLCRNMDLIGRSDKRYDDFVIKRGCGMIKGIRESTVSGSEC